MRKHLANEAEARALIRELFVSSTDLDRDNEAGTLTIRIHRMAFPVHDRAIALLLADLNAADFRHTGYRPPLTQKCAKPFSARIRMSEFSWPPFFFRPPITASSEGIHHGNSAGEEIGDVECCHDMPVRERGGGNQAVGHGEWSAGGDMAPAVGHLICEWQDVAGEIAIEGAEPEVGNFLLGDTRGIRHATGMTTTAPMPYRRCGRSGLMLPVISLGLWHNFGDGDDLDVGGQILRRAFDLGITHFDLANNYGPPPGSAERNFGDALRRDFAGHRDEMILSTKAGHLMWDGPYGEWGSRKHVLASLDQSLARMRVDYVDIFYSHRPDPGTPLEETMGALATAVQQGKALYAGISKYPGPLAREAIQILRRMGVPCLIHQPPLNLLNRWPEANGLPQVLADEGVGCIGFSPLAQGMLTDKYLAGIPAGSRADRPEGFLQSSQVTAALPRLRAFADIARERGESLATMAMAWVLQQPYLTSTIVGARTLAQLEENLLALSSQPVTPAQSARLDAISAGQADEA